MEALLHPPLPANPGGGGGDPPLLCNRVALQSRCTAWQSHCVALGEGEVREDGRQAGIMMREDCVALLCVPLHVYIHT